MFLYESTKYCAGRRELCLYLSVPFFHARSFKETCVFRKVFRSVATRSNSLYLSCLRTCEILRTSALLKKSRRVYLVLIAKLVTPNAVKMCIWLYFGYDIVENIYKYFPMPRADRCVVRANTITVKKLYLSFHRQKMASVPISSAYVKQLERNSMSETKAQSNGTELAKYEKNQDIAQERRPFSSCISNVQTMLQSSLQSLQFFSSAPSEQRFKECVDRP